MEIFVMSQNEFNRMLDENSINNDNIESVDNTFFISINGTSVHERKTKLSDKQNVKVLFFDDVDKDIEVPAIGMGRKELAKVFTEKQAKELFDFIKKHVDKEKCFVHCAAGISRSGAVGTFINQYTGSDKYWFTKTNRHIIPNSTVLSLLHKVCD